MLREIELRLQLGIFFMPIRQEIRHNEVEFGDLNHLQHLKRDSTLN